MNVSFRLFSGRIINLEFEPFQTINDVKLKLSALLQSPQDSFKFLYKTRTLTDDMKLSDANIMPGSVIQVLTIKNQSTRPTPPSVQTAEKKSKLHNSYTALPPRPDSVPVFQKLPPRRGSIAPSQKGDPPIFQQSVKFLVEMGFEKEQCEKALRASFYNLDRAAEYLIEGNIPDEICNDVAELQKQRDELIHECDRENHKIQHIYESLSEEEKRSIKKLESMGFSQNTVIQVYFACNKDEITASSCLASINDD